MKFKLLDTFLADDFYVTQNYSNNATYYSQFGLLYHEGVDFGNTNKTKEIRCVHGGECLTAYSNSYGRYVIVLDYQLLCATWYCHLSKANVVNGQQVKTGDVIGNMGDTGNSTAPHCHFNFVIINSAGVRQYKEPKYNQGFLDPLYPRDNSSPKKYGINYEIEWVKNIPVETGEGENMSDALTECLAQHTKLVDEANKKDKQIESLISSLESCRSDINNKDKQLEEKNKEITKLNEEKEATTKNLEELTNKNKELVEKNKELTTENISLSEENDSLADELIEGADIYMGPQTLLQKLQSRKLWLAIAGSVIPPIVNKVFNLNLSVGEIFAILTPTLLYIGVEGINDIVK